MTGILYVVPTPVGNLEDMTFRAIKVLKASDLILAEDTRTTGKLTSHYDISTPKQSFHMHNEHKVVDRFVNQLAGGANIALVSDAGTPGISDPGFLLIRAAAAAGIGEGGGWAKLEEAVPPDPIVIYAERPPVDRMRQRGEAEGEYQELEDGARERRVAGWEVRGGAAWHALVGRQLT